MKMEMEMEITNSLNNLKNMELIDITKGEKIGFIRDFVIDCDEYKIISIIIPSVKISWFGKNDDIELPWSCVKKIGIDIILIDTSECFE
jgi:YlmC/YmxH family sporulation protein